MTTSLSWNKVPAFSSTTEDDLVTRLAQLAATYSLRSVNFEHEPTAQAMLLSFDTLFWIAAQPGSDFLIYDIARSDVFDSDRVLLVSSGCTSDAIDSLLTALTDGTFGAQLPPWAGVQKSPIANVPFVQQLEARGAEKASGILDLRLRLDEHVVSELYRATPAADDLKSSFKAALGGLEQAPEDVDNLDQRSKWFQRRSGVE